MTLLSFCSYQFFYMSLLIPTSSLEPNDNLKIREENHEYSNLSYLNISVYNLYTAIKFQCLSSTVMSHSSSTHQLSTLPYLLHKTLQIKKGGNMLVFDSDSFVLFCLDVPCACSLILRPCISMPY